MNNWYGFRIPKAFSSPDNWYAINKYGAKQLILWSSLMIVAGIIMPFASIPPSYRLIPLILVAVISNMKTLAYAQKLPG